LLFANNWQFHGATHFKHSQKAMLLGICGMLLGIFGMLLGIFGMLLGIFAIIECALVS